MSLKATSWVWNWSETTGSTRLVHLCLADRASENTLVDHTMRTFPASRPFIEAKTRLSIRQISRCLAELEEKGYIQRKSGGIGTSSSVFILLFDENLGVTPCPGGVTPSPSRGDTVSPLTNTGIYQREKKEKGSVFLSGTGYL